MAQDQQLSERTQARSVRIVIAGVIVSAALGAGLGVWARSDPPPAREAPAPAPLQPLQIVVEDTLPPVGQLLEVLPADLVAAASRPALPAPPGLAAVEPATAAAPLPVVALRRAAPPERAPDVRKARPNEPAARLAKTSSKPGSKSAKARKAPTVKLAQANTPKAKTKPASRPKATLRAEAAPKARKPAAQKKPPTKLAKATPPKTRRPEKAVAPRGEGPLRVARDACALPDPGAALVCADRGLAARDQQLQRVYRRAEAAGVPAAALRRREARWLEVRAAAAREAPWAVEDVYVARISEINDMIRDAREN